MSAAKLKAMPPRSPLPRARASEERVSGGGGERGVWPGSVEAPASRTNRKSAGTTTQRPRERPDRPRIAMPRTFRRSQFGGVRLGQEAEWEKSILLEHDLVVLEFETQLVLGFFLREEQEHVAQRSVARRAG